MSVGERQVIYDFYDTKEFPLVLGAVDGTLIPIKAPSVDEHLYVCRKGYLLWTNNVFAMQKNNS
jgi:hypothetical protein